MPCVISLQTLTRYFYMRIILAIWLLPIVNLSLKNLRPYYTHKNQCSYEVNVAITFFYFFLAKVTTLFLK